MRAYDDTRTATKTAPTYDQQRLEIAHELLAGHVPASTEARLFGLRLRGVAPGLWQVTHDDTVVDYVSLDAIASATDLLAHLEALADAVEATAASETEVGP